MTLRNGESERFVDPIGLGALLKFCRSRIEPEALVLGGALRPRARIGRPVTQQEVADAAQISREWYAKLELGQRSRISPTLLGRLADVLMMNEAEQRRLFSAALPELRVLRSDCDAIKRLQLTPLRSLLRKMWYASSEDEILAAALEYCSSYFRGVSLSMFARQVSVGAWVHPVLPPVQTLKTSVIDLSEIIRNEFSVYEVEEWNLAGALIQPGDCCFVSDVFERSPIRGRISDALRRVDLVPFEVVAAHVRSRFGYTGNLAFGFHPSRLEVSKNDLDLLGAVAQFASLALSG
jgi:transcriptional regulator with XRE-family HTH domain